jgi:hypothetical protein
VKFPSKVTPYQASILAKFPAVLSSLEAEDLRPDELYKKVKSKVTDVGEFLEILDCLYALGKIELREEGGMLHYAG